MDKRLRKVAEQVRGQRTVDGAGVHLVRVLGQDTVYSFDPFLMLDSFDSKNPRDYVAGFPMHPHRGIETITYLIEGEIDHEDSMGNKGAIHSGQSQWMTAGSGILHQEMPKASPRMLGLQLWLNLPSREKMTKPAYFDISESMIGHSEDENADYRVISGEHGTTRGVEPRHIQATVMDVNLKEGKTVVLDTSEDENVFIFTIEGDAVVGGERIKEKTAVLFGPGNAIEVSAPQGERARFIFCSGKPVHEPVAWAGPVVMNTESELEKAFSDLREGTFIREDAVR